MGNYSLAESPSGLVHHVQVLSSGRLITSCGREVNLDTWTRIRDFDVTMFGKGPRAVRAMIELPVCDRCFT